MGWSIPLDKLAEKAQLDLETVARRATLQVFRNVVMMSPVDSGRFKGAWQVSYGAPNTSTASKMDKSPVGSIGAAMTAVVEQANTLPVGGITYISNSLPYARTLENGGYPNPPKNPTGKTEGGYSIQAPAGMVRVTAIQFNDYVQRVISK